MASIVTSCTGNKDLVTAQNWVFRGFVNMFTILGIIVLATTMAIQSIIIGVLEKFSATSLESFHHHHHSKPQKLSAIGSESYRKGWGKVQSQCRNYIKSNPLVWTDGVDHMVTRQKFNRLLSKHRLRRKWRQVRLREDLPYDQNRSSRYSNIASENQYAESKKTGNVEHRRISISGSPIIIRPIIGNMPRAGQPGALSFDGNNVTDFLKDWDMECEEYGLTDVQKCKKLPRYCNKDIGEAIQMLQGYVNEDWTVLQQELKQLFWRTDPPKETTAALFKLIGDAKDGKINVDMYVLKYTSITNALLKRNSLSKFHQRVLLLDGLSEELQTKIFEYCSEKG